MTLTQEETWQERQDWKEIGMFQEEEDDEVRTIVYGTVWLV